MSTMIFPNLPVADVTKSREFYTALGFTANEQFSDENTAAIVVSDEIVIMLLNRPRFADFTDKEIVDAHTSIQMSNALGVASREEVDRLADAALAMGGTPAGEAQDLGFLYSRDVEDLDGHRWGFVWMDPSAVEG